MNRPYGRRAALGKAALSFSLLPAIARAQQPVRLLALGDSLTAGFGLPTGQGFVPQLQAALAARGHAVRVLDGGVSGDTIAGGLARLDWALADNPQAAIVALGGNDGLRGLPIPASRAALNRILDRLEAARLPVLLSGMISPPNLGAAYGREFTAMFADAAAARPAVIYQPFFLENVAAVRELNQADGIHPNQAGVRVMIQGILPFVERLLERVR